MAFFGDSFDNLKDTIEAIGYKTGEVISEQKTKLEISVIERKRDKDFIALGKIYYSMLNKEADIPQDVAEIMSSVKKKNKQISALKKQLASKQQFDADKEK